MTLNGSMWLGEGAGRHIRGLVEGQKAESQPSGKPNTAQESSCEPNNV